MTNYPVAVGGDGSTLDALESDLTDRFGPPVELGVGLGDHVAAYATILWVPGLVLVLTTTLALFGTRLWRRRHDVHIVNGLIAGLALSSAITAVVCYGAFGDTGWIALEVLFAAAAVFAWITRSVGQRLPCPNNITREQMAAMTIRED